MKVPGPSGVTDGHSIDFVGFKQDRRFPGGGYLIFRNSWGTGFQEQGYGYILSNTR
jgi:C1A family cysteine protease